jgi:hypothetical protein
MLQVVPQVMPQVMLQVTPQVTPRVTPQVTQLGELQVNQLGEPKVTQLGVLQVRQGHLLRVLPWGVQAERDLMLQDWQLAAVPSAEQAPVPALGEWAAAPGEWRAAQVVRAALEARVEQTVGISPPWLPWPPVRPQVLRQAHLVQVTAPVPAHPQAQRNRLLMCNRPPGSNFLMTSWRWCPGWTRLIKWTRRRVCGRLTIQ